MDLEGPRRIRGGIKPPKPPRLRSLWDKTYFPSPCADIRFAIYQLELQILDARWIAPGEVAELEDALADHQREYDRRGCKPSLSALYR